MRTSEAAKGKWFGILSNLGIDQNYLRNVHGPCPCCGGKDRFRFDDKGGEGTYFCSHCGAGDGFKLAMEYTGLDFKMLAQRIDSFVGNIKAQPANDKARDPRIALNKIRKSLVKNTSDTPVVRYLASRGLAFGARYMDFHPGLKYWHDKKVLGTFAAKVALLTSSSGQPVSYHITYLNQDGSKASVPAVKKIMTPAGSLDGCAVRLGIPTSGHVGIAEGIETALAVTKQYKIPCWASCNAGLLKKFAPPEGINRITIFGDNDESFTGQAAAYELARRLKNEGYEVIVMIPDQAGIDYADMVAA